MSLKNLQVLIHTKLHEKSCCYLTIIYMKKHHRKLRQTKFCQRALFAICTCVTTLHSCYMRNALAFSLSEARNFFLYIIKVLMSCFPLSRLNSFFYSTEYRKNLGASLKFDNRLASGIETWWTS